ncbi:hypothetical protein GE061_019099 [Apolygus lucorum]|uniref:Uncharacterized protein n=1 Tax=Apolygus lucorum TaxID=248454 RepID=A0A8S9X8V2_APOLU|nr:hypothetical protein GE061_019099 [Apolygus lucorum]
MIEFDYCCLDCIPSSFHHIACRSWFPPIPSTCKLVDSILPHDITTRPPSTTSTSTPRSTTNNGTTNATTVTTTPHNSTTELSTVTTTASTKAPRAYRIKRDESHNESHLRISSDELAKKRVTQEQLLDVINAVRRNWTRTLNVSNMAELVLDDEVHDIAKLVAKRCNTVKNFCSDTPAFEVKMLSYNVTFDEGTEINAQKLVDFWSKGRDDAIREAKENNTYRKFDKE